MEEKLNLIADRIHWLRAIVCQMTQEDFADRLDVKHRNVISDWERGKRKPGIKNCYLLIELAKEYGHTITMNWLRPDHFE